MTYQTKLRTHEIIPNENICFPIGTILAVRKKYEKLQLPGVFEKYKKKGKDINSIIQAYLSYKLFISLIRFEIKELKNTSTKFIKNSLMNLTVTVNFEINKSKKYIFANFDLINKLILLQNEGIIWQKVKT
ncbi:Uncharacterised protein [uncultured archaeon]|nr:Uncharacterised protein [uncultured archaeon]